MNHVDFFETPEPHLESPNALNLRPLDPLPVVPPGLDPDERIAFAERALADAEAAVRIASSRSNDLVAKADAATRDVTKARATLVAAELGAWTPDTFESVVGKARADLELAEAAEKRARAPTAAAKAALASAESIEQGARHGVDGAHAAKHKAVRDALIEKAVHHMGEAMLAFAEANAMPAQDYNGFLFAAQQKLSGAIRAAGGQELVNLMRGRLIA